MKIGTRGSALALWQARTVAREILEAGGPSCDVVVIRTSGDEGGPPQAPETGTRVATPPGQRNVKATFVKEIEDALLDGRIDLAVHSSKDLPAILPEGLTLGAALAREDPRDALLLPGGSIGGKVEDIRRALGVKPRIGTSSVRRIAQLTAVFRGASFVPIRGNVDTRLRKLDAGECDALVLAAAGLKRLGLEARVSTLLPIDVCVPAPGQGIVTVEIRTDAPADVRQATASISNAESMAALMAERAVVRALFGGCQMPLGAIAQIDGQELDMLGLVSSLDGSRAIRAHCRGRRDDPAATGRTLAQSLLEQGANDILSSLDTK